MSLGPIKTPVLRYWRLTRHPFDDYILRGESLGMFVNRDGELHQLYNALGNRFNGIFGAHGVGKSSFLRQFQALLKEDGIATVYVHLTGTTEKALYREILAGILKAHVNRSIRTARSFKLDAANELERVDAAICEAREAEFGVSAPVKGTMKKVTEKHFETHTEETARALIAGVVTHATTSFVVIVDDLERMKLFVDGEETYCHFVSTFARTVDELFAREGICFVASLDTAFVQRIRRDALDAHDATSFSFGELVHIPSFSPDELVALINRRLNHRARGKSVKKFITEDAFWMLVLATSGHPRRALAVLRSAMEFVEANERERIIDQEALAAGLAKRDEKIHESHAAILRYLSDAGPSSPSDKEFQKAAGLTRVPLQKRVDALEQRISLIKEEKKVGRTSKKLYSLPEVSFE